MTLVPYQSIVHIISWYLIGGWLLLFRLVSFSLASGSSLGCFRRASAARLARPRRFPRSGLPGPLSKPAAPLAPLFRAPLVPQLLASQPMVTRSSPACVRPVPKTLDHVPSITMCCTRANVHGPPPPHLGHPRRFHTGFQKIAKLGFKSKFSIRMS